MRGGKGGEAGTRVSCASQECLVWPGWELYDWAVTHGRRRWPGPAQRCSQPPPHPTAGSCYTHSWHSTGVPSPLPHPAHFIPWHSNLHLWSCGTTAQIKAAEGQHMLNITAAVVFWPWTRGKSPLLLLSLQLCVEQMDRMCEHSGLT